MGQMVWEPEGNPAGEFSHEDEFEATVQITLQSER